jgi:putative DNA primase/helicase
VVWTAVTETDEHGSTVRTLAKSKANITSDEGGYRYTLHVGPVANIKSTVSVEWGEFVSGKASDIINDAEQSTEERSQGSEAREFLLSMLEDGPRDSKSILSESRKQGISRRVLDSAKRALKVIVSKHGFQGRWEWKLPDCNL